MVRVVVVVVVMILAVVMMPLCSRALDVNKLRQLAAKKNITCILVFGDSSVDPGNNNRLTTTFKGNFAPYGKDFINGLPTGRFSNGRLATDFIAEAFGYTTIIPGFLERNLKKEELLHGISFASAASGYDDLTANFTNVLPVSKQLQYLLHYKIQLRRLVGVKRTEEIIRNAIFILSMGTNDFIQNYFLEPNRSKQFSLEEYENYLTACMFNDIKIMHSLGATRLAVVGIPPLGCMPIVKTLMGATKCVDSYNKASLSFNSKMRAKLATLSLGVKNAYIDTYDIVVRAMASPEKYGFEVTSKGCCGSGTFEFGETCKGLITCKDPTKYVFWDAVHPTEKMYRLIADEALASLNDNLLV
ncbi:hypothetical protein HHK36_005062 [Tetracentron sinense]|uniref:GDSL esterase/lipase n=1 Tax=Tetracentron sinense TaxID=13715 RepID=A0A835DMG6_TETSI|nr:hypothetical protein HHK36_005062 [Tetracentron sinense]